MPFTEDHYRRRKPHPNFQDHISLEKHVVKLGKTVSTKCKGNTIVLKSNIFLVIYKIFCQIHIIMIFRKAPSSLHMWLRQGYNMEWGKTASTSFLR